jgi:hypothetical protein
MKLALTGAVSLALHAVVLAAPWLFGLAASDPFRLTPEPRIVSLVAPFKIGGAAPSDIRGAAPSDIRGAAPPIPPRDTAIPPRDTAIPPRDAMRRARPPAVTLPTTPALPEAPAPADARPAVAMATIPATTPPPPPIDDKVFDPPEGLTLGGVEDAEPPPARPLPAEASIVELAKLRDVTEGATVSARAAGKPFVGRREIFEFLLDHPELATQLTQALKVARYKVWRTPDGLVLDDGWGAKLRFSILAPSSNARIVYAEGHYEQTLLPDIPGKAVIMIEFDSVADSDGRDVLSTSVTSYVKVESGFAAFFIRLAGDAVLRKAELEAQRLVRVFARVSQKIDEDPHAVWAQLRDRPNVPAADLEAFRRLLRLP